LLGQPLDRYKIALSKVEFLLQVERSGTPMTLNHYFSASLQKRWSLCSLYFMLGERRIWLSFYTFTLEVVDKYIAKYLAPELG
jgi:hypothetical protein